MEFKLTEEALKIIEHILKRGNSAEIKKERDNIVVVEIQRVARLKEPIKK